MEALAQGSSSSNIAPFARFVAELAGQQVNEPLPQPR
jgi:hypothetical protein